MPRHTTFAILAALALTACKIHRLDTLPTERDPTAPDAPITEYHPPPDVLTTELSSPDANDVDPHAGHRMKMDDMPGMKMDDMPGMKMDDMPGMKMNDTAATPDTKAEPPKAEPPKPEPPKPESRDPR